MMRSSFFLLISLFAAASAARAAPPSHVEIRYELLRNGSQVAEVDYHIEHDARTYRITEVSKGKGLLALQGTMKRVSRGLIVPEGLRPLEFTDERSWRQPARATFNWKAKTVTMQYKGDPRTEPMPPHADDRLAFLFDFAFAPLPKGKVTWDLLDGRGQSHHVYNVGGKQRISTPAGVFDTVKLWRGPENDRTEIYLADDHSYLPVRVLIVDPDGTRVEQIATRISSQ